jgi:hypothetical protein
MLAEQITELSKEEMKDFLDAHCYRKTEGPVAHHFTEGELQEMKAQLARDQVDIYEATLKLQKAKEIHKFETKEPKERVSTTVTKLSDGYEMRDKTLYYMDAQEEGLMYIYDEDGRLVDKRALLPEERQTNIFSMHKNNS